MQLEDNEIHQILLLRTMDLKQFIEKNPNKCPKEEMKKLALWLNMLYSDGRAIPMMKVTVECYQ